MNRLSSKIILSNAAAYFSNECRRGLSCALGRNLCLPARLIDIRLTYRCNLKCRQCHLWLQAARPELSTQAWKRIILDIRNFMGPCFIRFDGGEPFYREDFLELLDFCTRNDIASLVTTNGTLISQEIAGRLCQNQIAMVQISLDGFKPDTHDRLRGEKGVHQKALNAIELLRSKVPVRINTTIMEDNLDELLSLAEFARQRSIQISFQPVMNYNATDLKDFFQPDRAFVPKDLQKLEGVIRVLAEEKRYAGTVINSSAQLSRMRDYFASRPIQRKQCEIIYNRHLRIKPTGEVFICNFLEPVGCLTRDSLRSIWQGQSIQERLCQMRMCQQHRCLVMRGCHKEHYGAVAIKALRYLRRPSGNL